VFAVQLFELERQKGYRFQTVKESKKELNKGKQFVESTGCQIAGWGKNIFFVGGR
jgi:hypothetical protein